MARVIYAIIRADGCWRVICERRRIGRYDTCEQAALAAVALARQASEDNHASEVLLQDKAGELWPVAQFDPVGFCSPIESALEALAANDHRAAR
ncbi:MAG TPA: hypothetical protein VGE54_03690 [Brevundimonas sp.]